MTHIPFNLPHIPPATERYMLEALRSGKHCGNHSWNQKCIAWLKDRFGFGEVFMVPSGTAALEMGVMLAGVAPGDEVILPSYTFSSTATAVLLSGGKPVFCEIEPNTMNLDPRRLKELITPRTKMIIPIDYAGIPCDVDAIMSIAEPHNITVMVDAAQSMNSKDAEGRWAGSNVPLATFSFHETKNFGCGEGGALIVNNPEWVQRAHFLQEKGTDRRLVLDGVKSKYGWVDKGSSYLLSDILAAMLFAQFEHMDEITSKRANVTAAYRKATDPFEAMGNISTPRPPAGSAVNHHAFFIILESAEHRQRFIQELKEKYNVFAYIGYVALHSFKKGLELGYKPDDLPITESLAARIVRLPLYADLGGSEIDLNYTVNAVHSVLSDIYPMGRNDVG
jgi:dTDP-4-amino-4,6-dideoxygalactose transaminase